MSSLPYMPPLKTADSGILIDDLRRTASQDAVPAPGVLKKSTPDSPSTIGYPHAALSVDRSAAWQSVESPRFYNQSTQRKDEAESDLEQHANAYLRRR